MCLRIKVAKILMKLHKGHWLNHKQNIYNITVYIQCTRTIEGFKFSVPVHAKKITFINKQDNDYLRKQELQCSKGLRHLYAPGKNNEHF